MGDAGLHFLDEAGDLRLAELREDEVLFEGFLDFAVVGGPDGRLLVALNVVAVFVHLITD